MDRSRLSKRPKSNYRSVVTEYFILLGCLCLVSTLCWRAVGDWIAAGAQAGRTAVVVESADDCLGRLCTKPVDSK
jgi:hypothetical protein